jgi:tRNA A37 threonylcarbamoyladenosine modification protein TsaB
VVGVCTLDVLAAGARAVGVEGGFVAASDARRKEVYWARYDAAGARVDGPYVMRPSDLAAALRPGEGVVGRGAQLYADVLPAIEGPADPDAGVLAGVVADQSCELLPLQPLYLRRPDAVEPGGRKRVR